jgi:surface polysaccharide O-acyltransferase-like enzyme
MSSPKSTAKPHSVAEPGRRRDLDSMRIFVVAGLVLFHSARIFDTGDFYVKHEPTSELVDVVISFAALWGMPLLFIVSGMGMAYSLRSRTTGEFGVERLRRLLVPLIFGVIVIVPPQIWTRLRSDPTYDETYLNFLPRFLDVRLEFSNFPFVVGADPTTGLFEWGHLWFLLLLFSWSLLLLPVIRYLQSPGGRRLVDRLADQVDRFWIVVAAGVPLAFLEGALGSEEEWAGWNRYSYAVFLLYGYLLAADPRYGRALGRHRRSALILGIATFAVVGALFALADSSVGADPLLDFDVASVSMRMIKGLSGWLWVIAIMGLARGKREGAPRGSREPTAIVSAGAYASEAVLPFYVLHQTVIVLLGFSIVEWPIHAALQYLIICTASLATTLAIYDLAVRRTPPTRFLFGMKGLRSTGSPDSATR